MKKQDDVPLIFNLFPRHFKTIDNWAEIIPHVKEMGFNAILSTLFTRPDFPEACNAVKDYYRLNLFSLKRSGPFRFQPP